MIYSGHLAEAQLEEVLHSLGLRIRSLFKWAKSDVSGFDDLSPMDQKALLRRTVPEMVMLGFAKGSVPFDSKDGWGQMERGVESCAVRHGDWLLGYELIRVYCRLLVQSTPIIVWIWIARSTERKSPWLLYAYVHVPCM